MTNNNIDLSGSSQFSINNGIKRYKIHNDLFIEREFINGLAHGYEKHYYNNGKLKMEFNLVNGVIEGYRKEYGRNGKISILAEYVNGLNHGKDYYYFRCGKKIKSSYSWKKGMFHGLCIEMLTKNKRQDIKTWNKHKLHGVVINFKWKD